MDIRTKLDSGAALTNKDMLELQALMQAQSRSFSGLSDLLRNKSIQSEDFQRLATIVADATTPAALAPVELEILLRKVAWVIERGHADAMGQLRNIR